MPSDAQVYTFRSCDLHTPGSISSTFENLDIPNMEAMGELSAEFRSHHYLSGLVLAELAHVLEGK